MWLPNVFPMLAFLPVAESFLETLPPGHEHFRRGFILAIGWAATCGGLATPVGTPTNGIILFLFGGPNRNRNSNTNRNKKYT